MELHQQEFFASGSGAPGAAITNVQKWNGTSWTEINDVNTGRRQSKGSGTTGAGIIAGGYTPSPATVVGVVESFNGTSWTETTDLNTARTAAGSSMRLHLLTWYILQVKRLLIVLLQKFGMVLLGQKL